MSLHLALQRIAATAGGVACDGWALEIQGPPMSDWEAKPAKATHWPLMTRFLGCKITTIANPLFFTGDDAPDSESHRRRAPSGTEFGSRLGYNRLGESHGSPSLGSFSHSVCGPCAERPSDFRTPVRFSRRNPARLGLPSHLRILDHRQLLPR